MTLIAKIGMNIGNKRYEPGDKIDTRGLTDKQTAEMVKLGDAETAEEAAKAKDKEE